MVERDLDAPRRGSGRGSRVPRPRCADWSGSGRCKRRSCPRQSGRICPPVSAWSEASSRDGHGNPTGAMIAAANRSRRDILKIFIVTPHDECSSAELRRWQWNVEPQSPGAISEEGADERNEISESSANRSWRLDESLPGEILRRAICRSTATKTDATVALRCFAWRVSRAVH